jgi:hypothetical protein
MINFKRYILALKDSSLSNTTTNPKDEKLTQVSPKISISCLLKIYKGS